MYANNKYPVLIFSSLWFLFLTWQAKDHPFFWDTVQLASKQAHWFYENNFQYFFLPEQIDSGHPPMFGMGLALLWVCFGKTLWVGHFAMLPFLLGILFFSFKIGDYFFEGRGLVILLLLISVDPFVLGQSVLVSPDIPVLFGFLLGLYGVIYRKGFCKVFAALLLTMMSMRGMMLVVVLYLFDSLRHLPAYNGLGNLFVHFFKKAIPYIPSGLFALAFLGAHYQQVGWIGYHENSSWAPSFEKVGLLGSFRNIALIGWRLMDFGRIAICVLLALGIVSYFFKNRRTGFVFRNKLSQKAKEIIVLLLLAVLILTPSLILHKHLTAHRYLLPITMIMNVAVVYVLLELVTSVFWQKVIGAVLVISLLTGNAWVYPKKIAQGWDSTLGHWPYYQLRQQMLDYIAVENIPLEMIGSAFPNNADLKYTDLKPGIGAFPTFDLANQKFIFYSNIYNDFSDDALDELDRNWIIRKRFDQYPVCVILYQKK